MQSLGPHAQTTGSKSRLQQDPQVPSVYMLRQCSTDSGGQDCRIRSVSIIWELAGKAHFQAYRDWVV